jgi:hypothetical protein
VGEVESEETERVLLSYTEQPTALLINRAPDAGIDGAPDAETFERMGHDLPRELLARYDTARAEWEAAETAIEEWWAARRNPFRGL